MSDDASLSTPAGLQRQSQRTSATGTDLLRAGLMVGAIGAGGALLGAVCPLCVVATPALVGAGAVQKLRALLLARRARAALPAPVSAGP